MKAIAVAVLGFLAWRPASADVAYRFVETGGVSGAPPIEQAFSVTDASYASGAVNMDLWCGGGLPQSYFQGLALADGWAGGFLFPAAYGYGSVHVGFDPSGLLTGALNIIWDSDYQFIYGGAGTDWTALITDAGQTIYSANGYWVDPAPEPASWGLFGMGLVGLVLVRRYRA